MIIIIIIIMVNSSSNDKYSMKRTRDPSGAEPPGASPSTGAEDRTLKIVDLSLSLSLYIYIYNTSEIIVDFQWRFKMDKVVFSNGSSIFSGIFQRIVTSPVDFHWNWPMDFQ